MSVLFPGLYVRALALAITLAFMAAAILPSPVAAQCFGCDPTGVAPAPEFPGDGPRPLRIEVRTDIDFGPLVTGVEGGVARLDPVTGERTAEGDVALLSGYPVRGEVFITGEPNQPIRIEMPQTIELSTIDGETITITGIITTLDGAPRLDMAGQLVFKFGGKLKLDGAATGNFRGRIPITANYQ